MYVYLLSQLDSWFDFAYRTEKTVSKLIIVSAYYCRMSLAEVLIRSVVLSSFVRIN